MLVKQVQEAFQAGDIYWPADLMVELERKQPGLTLDWAIACVQALLDNAPARDKEQQLKWLAELSSAKRSPDCSALKEKGLQIWHTERDINHTAISHLYAALYHYAKGDDRAYRGSVISALCVAGGHPFYRQTAVAIPLALFEKFETGTD